MGLFSSTPVVLEQDLQRVLVLPDKPEWLKKDNQKGAAKFWSSLDASKKRDIRLLVCTRLEGMVYVDSQGVTITGGVWRGFYKFTAIRDCRAKPFRQDWVVDFSTLTAGDIFCTFRTQDEAARLVEVVHGI